VRRALRSAPRPGAGVLVAMGLLLGVPVGPAASPGAQQVPTVTDSHVRIVTWNIRRYPEPSTDVDRVARILADLDADVVAVQEIVDPDAVPELLRRVNDRLVRRTTDGAPRRYRHVLAETGGGGGLFVGYIYDETSVRLTGVETLTSLQMTPDLRPALLARVESLRGGLDLLILTAHTDSGTKLRDYSNRMGFLDALAGELGPRRSEEADVVVLGDLNTMGHFEEGGLRRVTGEEELAILDRKAREMGLARLAPTPACTEYYRGRGSLLDHILVAAPMREVPLHAVARVLGYGAEAACRPLDPETMPHDYRRVSDHCPVVIDLLDVDWD
jgi:endonuclease/exonuclease/phosphatase family metal-dependent hydrolase